MKQASLIRQWLISMAFVVSGVGASAAPAASYDATVATTWFGLALDAARQTPNVSPPVASRAFAYLGVSLYEAARPGMPGHASLAGQLNGLSALPDAAGDGRHDAAVAANVALASMMREMFPGMPADLRRRVDAEERAFHERFARSLPVEVVRSSEQYGRSLVRALQAWAAADGSERRPPYVSEPRPGSWQPTSEAQREALLPGWGTNRTFALRAGDECPVLAPAAFSEQRDSTFFAQAVEVYRTAGALTAEQREVAVFWADDPGKTSTPPGHWVSILTQVLTSRGAGLDVAAEGYARLGVALADAFIGCWHAKYAYNLLRPVTFVRAHLDAAWVPLLNTPAFPEYPSGHSVQSGAAVRVLEAMFGREVAFVDHTHARLGLPARSFASFRAAASEAAESRLLGGIHFREAIENGLSQGECIGEKVNALKWRQ